MRNTLKLITSVIICLLAGFIGSFFTQSSIATWYQTLNKPFFNPPNWVFAPVWTTLYIMMGISLYLILIQKDTKKAAITFGVQLILNILWSVFFFGLKNPLLAFIEILFLWALILYTIMLFYKKSRAAAYLLIPYAIWVTFAAMLNASIWLLN